MLVVAACVLAAGLLLAFSLPVTYVARAHLQGTPGLSVAGEAELLRSPDLAGDVVSRLGLARMYPDLARKTDRAHAEREAALRVARDLGVGAVGPSVLAVSFRHRDPQRARLILNALLDRYVEGRRAGLSSVAPARDFERRLAVAESAYVDFLRRHGVVDLDADAARLAQLQTAMEQGRDMAEVRALEGSARLAALDLALRRAGEGEAGALALGRAQTVVDIAAARRGRGEFAARATALQARRMELLQLGPQARSLWSRRQILSSAWIKVSEKEEAQRLAIAKGLSGPRILHPAEARKAPDYRSPIVFLTVVLAIGSALWAGFLRLSLRPGTLTAKTAARTYGLPLLGAAKQLGPLQDLSLEAAGLWSSLEVGAPSRIIQVTAARRGEGASTIARALAQHAARKLGRSVWLVDLDLANSAQYAALLGDLRRYGELSGPMRGSPDGSAFFRLEPPAFGATGQQVADGDYLLAHRIGVARWWVTRFMRERLTGRQAARIEPTADYWSALRRHADVVIVDGPPAEASGAALAVAPFMDQIVLVVSAEEPTLQTPARYRDALSSAGGPLAGLFVNRAS
jgi:hypothetical protein